MTQEKVSDGDAFVCIKGAGFDGHKFIRDVVSKGSSSSCCYG